MSSKPRAYLFAGGGTGGHLYPALAIAEHINELDPDAVVRFICSDRPIDAEILTKASVEFTPIDAKPASKSPSAMVAFAKAWRSSRAKVHAVIYELLPTHDVVVVAMGGFVAAPAAWAARKIRVPVVLVNLDAVPGKANLLIARFADQVCTAFPIRNKQWHTLGPIVRANATGTKGTGHEIFGLDPSQPTLLITGGSQGSKSINGFMRAMVGTYPSAFKDWQVIHQTGPDDGKDLAVVYERATIRAWVHPYIDRMDSAWGCATLAVGRCGAGTVSEAWAAGVPSVLFPYPFHKDQHQKHNAQVLVDVGAAAVFDDHIDPTANINAHGQAFASILSTPSKLDTMRAGFDQLADANGARAAAELLIGFRAG